ncbi:type IV secretion system DNA-binding domain-containing protein [Candidatus Peregrinibacteria bacterium]|nr:type IV secretion system DNA-binding domain-containing protein [Candidatus Peregrinibacteria bacterium]MBT4632203.1 type IV secretion system DNA-binding domain-containing protein [Candidatus Peregrinibacteria bacterium]MBT5516959.1 type IV secretion system DNA-binding domain-containing protein [Candidatus Peregrinibacteria bacterium]
MYLLKLCKTQEYSPHMLEHWLSTMQKSHKAMQIIFKEDAGKIKIISSHDLSKFFPGSKCEKTKTHNTKANFFLKQNKGPLLPIKRHSQFEDRVNKERIYPTNILIKEMVKVPNAFLKITFIPIAEKRRKNALKKAKKPWFQTERHFDQWESKAWFKLSLRRLIGPCLRRAATKLHTQNRNLDEHTESQHEREDPRRATLDKLSRPLFHLQISSSHNFQNFIQSFTLPYLGELSFSKKQQKIIFSAEELASFASFPNPKECAQNLQIESSYFIPQPANPLEILEEDRKRHLYLLGKTGMGKSSALLHLYKQDLKKSGSIILLDPHGDLIEDALACTSANRHKDIIILDPSEANFPLALNPIECHPEENPSLKASALIEMFKTLANGSWGPRLEYILRNSILTLLLAKNTTLLDLPRLLTNPIYCKIIISQIKDLELKRFWIEEFLNQDKRSRQEHIAPILNKVGPLLTSPILRNIFGQPKSKINLDNIIENDKILLISLSKGKLGEDASRMLGMIIISMIQSSLLRRAKLAPSKRKFLALTIDECQNFSTNTLLSMLSESRKYGLALTLANQYLEQHSPEVQAAILGNAGSLLAFRTSYADAKILAPTLGLIEEDLTEIAPFKAYAKFLKNNEAQPLFRLEVEKIQESMHPPSAEKLKTYSQKRYCRRQQLVEVKLEKRYNKRKCPLQKGVQLATPKK